MKIIAFCKDKKYYTQNEGNPQSCDGPPPRLAALNPAKAIETGIILFIDNGHVIKNLIQKYPKQLADLGRCVVQLLDQRPFFQII